VTLTQRAKHGKQTGQEDASQQVWWRNACWIAAGVCLIIGLGLSAEVWSGRPTPPPGVINWLSIGAVLGFVGGVGIHIAMGQRRTTLGQGRIIAALAGVEPQVIGRLVAQMQTIEQAIPAVRADIEQQRQADLTQMRDNGSKLFIAVNDRLDSVEESQTALMELVNDAARKTLEGMPDLIEGAARKMVEGLAELVEQAARRTQREAYKDAIRDLLEAMHEERAAASTLGDSFDAKYMADMSEAIRLGQEIERRRLQPPEQPQAGQ
jgi:hypothetical protein